MIAVANREAVKDLPPSLRKLIEEADAAANWLLNRIHEHEREHGCNWFVGFDFSRRGPRPYCPIDETLLDAWAPLQNFAKCLEYFLAGGEIPYGCREELVELCCEPGCSRPIWADGPRCKECVDGIVDRLARLAKLADEMGPTR